MESNYSKESQGVPAVHGQTRIAAASWQQTILAAKEAYQKGLTNQALQLYKAGLESAHRALDDRAELTLFLQIHIWG